MPAPEYFGDTSWTRDPGAVSGIEGTIVYYELPYSGGMDTAAAFRGLWQRGSSCPVFGYTHLRLKDGPTITEGVGGKGTATLRFEGEDISGEFGAAGNVITEYFNQARKLETADSSDWEGRRGIYRYNASIATRVYTQATRRSEPTSAPSLIDPVPLALLSGAKNAAAVDVLPDNTYKVVTNSGFESVTDLGGTWEHREYHEKILERVPFEQQS